MRHQLGQHCRSQLEENYEISAQQSFSGYLDKADEE